MSNREPEAELSESESLVAQRLLESARLDDLTPRATDEAWARFSGAFAAAASAASAPSVGDSAGRSGGAQRGGAAGTSAMRWLAIGAVAGSAATATWMSSKPESEVNSPAVTQSAASLTAVSQPASALIAGAASSKYATPQTPHQAPSHAPVATASAVRSTHGTRVRSTLAAEVARLDAARTALEIGAFDEALRLVTQFHRDFPNGELATEADVLRIEALSARNDQVGARREAARFLERHGNDPHADRVRQIANGAPKPTSSK
jgi:hypothetical protein